MIKRRYNRLKEMGLWGRYKYFSRLTLKPMIVVIIIGLTYLIYSVVTAEVYQASVIIRNFTTSEIQSGSFIIEGKIFEVKKEIKAPILPSKALIAEVFFEKRSGDVKIKNLTINGEILRCIGYLNPNKLKVVFDLKNNKCKVH